MFRFFLHCFLPLTTITKLFWPLESRGETRSEQVLALPLTQSPIEPFPRYPLVPNLKPFATPSHFHCVSKGSKRVLCPVVISERTLNQTDREAFQRVPTPQSPSSGTLRDAIKFSNRSFALKFLRSGKCFLPTFLYSVTTFSF